MYPSWQSVVSAWPSSAAHPQLSVASQAAPSPASSHTPSFGAASPRVQRLVLSGWSPMNSWTLAAIWTQVPSASASALAVRYCRPSAA
jgi:hypothetical protein